VDDLLMFMALRVQGVATPERASIASGTSVDDATSRLNTFKKEGLVEERAGRVCGFTLTAQGIQAFDELLAAEGLRSDDALTECYERFLALNERVLKLSTDWQLRCEGGIETPNDHSDPHYDATVIDRLAELHDRARTCLDKIACRAPRFALYRARLDDCVERLVSGDTSAFTALMAESYHTVWFELHQDLLLTLGMERGSS
jgi:hypothetical protein